VGRGAGSGERRGSRGRDLALLVLLVVVAAVSAYWVYRVGDLGARAVWNPLRDRRLLLPSR